MPQASRSIDTLPSWVNTAIGDFLGEVTPGGKQRLGRVTEADDPYLRSLLVMGARAVLASALNKNDPRRDSFS